MNLNSWNLVNLQAIAKALREMYFEEIIQLSEKGNNFCLNTPYGDYTFEGTKGVWGDIRVLPQSIRKASLIPSAAEFFIDTQSFSKMDDIVLANFLEELHNSLYGDLKILEINQNARASELSLRDAEEVQYYLFGHPKIINSKGRIGWAAADQDTYAPENKKTLQFMWLALAADTTAVLTESLDKETSWESLYLQSLSAEELAKFNQIIDLKSHRLIPVHPWQWDRYIRLQFAREIATQQIIPLGVAGDEYLPQISLRTFSNVSRPENCDIKLPLSILNTSSVRGIPSRYIAEGPQLSRDFEALCNTDVFLKDVRVLREIAGLSFEQTDFKRIAGAPYRYHELLGAIWRLNTRQVRHSETSLMTGALLYVDSQGESLAEVYIQKSKLSPQEWVARYARYVVLPLFHLQRQHGIGIVAHGQNIMLELQNFAPSGLILKDFQGDLRLSDKSTALKQAIPRLPAHYLIHDLITGHFITNLRYLSGILADRNVLCENDFYAVIGEELKRYYQQHSLTAGSAELQGIDLLSPIFDKVLINAVRFKVGYADSSQRPVPLLGTKMKNPLLNPSLDGVTQ